MHIRSLLLLFLTLSPVCLIGMESDKKPQGRLAYIQKDLSEKEYIADVATFLRACGQGDANTVTQILNKGVDPNENIIVTLNIPIDNSPIISATVEHWVDLVKNEPYATFLHWAAYNGQAMVTKVLLQNGSSVNAKNRRNMRPLHCAMFNPTHPQSVESLLAHGADPKLTDLDLNNPLHEIARHATIGFAGWRLSREEEKLAYACAIIQSLKKYGAPVFLQNKQLNTPIHLIASTPYDGVICSLLESNQSPELKAKLKKESHDRFITLLRCAFIMGIRLSKDVKICIFAQLPLDCKHAELEQLIIPQYISKEALRLQYVKATLSEADRAMLVLTLESPNIHGKTPMQLATHPNVQALLNPVTWY